MHELHLLKGLLADILRHARENRIARVTRIYLRLGGFTEIDPEILRQYFREHSQGTEAEGAAIDIEPAAGRELRLLSFDGE